MQRSPRLRTAAHQKNAKLDTIDCRVFRKVLLTSTLRTARAFFSTEDPDIEENQALALLRLKSYARENDYRTCTGVQLDEFYVRARRAAGEIAKFNDFLENEPWPLALKTLHENILHTSMFDDEILLNEGNSTELLPSLLEAYKKAYPALVSRKIAKLSQSSSRQVTLCDLSPCHEKDNVSFESMVPVRIEKEGSRTADESPESTSIDEICSELAKSKISALQVSVSVYIKEVLSPTDVTSHDMVLTEPPLSISETAVVEVVGLCKRILKPGWAFFAIIDWLDIPVWYKVLDESDFTVMPYPFVLCYKSTRLQKNRSTSFPQQFSFLALVAFAPGRRVDGFSVDFSSGYSHIECSHKRKFAVVDGILPSPHPLRKEGSRIHLVKDEKNVKLLCEINDHVQSSERVSF